VRQAREQIMNIEQGNDDGVATWKVELAVAALLFALGALVAFKSWQLGAGWRDDGPGAGYFPFYIGVLICLSSAVVMAGVALGVTRSDKVFVTRSQLKLVTTVFWPSLAYVVLTQLIGIYVGSVLFIAGFMVVVGKYRWAKSAAIALIVMAAAYMTFEVWFKVPLYKGWVNPLFFLGH
jgi:Tripartite tricarboxylate transporter TctB family